MILLRGSFSNTRLQHSPRKSARNLPQYFCGKLSGLRLAAISTSASFRIVDEEDEQGPQSSETNMLNHPGRIHANEQTYCWLLEGYTNSGSLIDAKKLHGRILKSGFSSYDKICSRLADVYASQGDLIHACQVIDEMPDRDVSFWNNLIFGLIGKKLTTMVLGLFSKMLSENVNPNEATFANVLCAIAGDNFHHGSIKQIHAKIIRHYFGS